MELKYILQALRDTAERHPNDIIANAASALAVRLESINTTFGIRAADVTDTERDLIRYVMHNRLAVKGADHRVTSDYM
jgi:hypothetical protein